MLIAACGILYLLGFPLMQALLGLYAQKTQRALNKTTKVLSVLLWPIIALVVLFGRR